MKKLLVFIILLAGLYTVYWFVMSGTVKKGALEKISEYESSGYTIRHAPLQMSGYPLRFDADIGPMLVTAPPTALGEAGAKVVLNTVDISGKAYNPLAWSLVHSGAGSLDIPLGPGQRWSFDTQTNRADINMTAGAGGALKRLNIKADTIIFTPSQNAAIPFRQIKSGLYDFVAKGDAATYSLTANDVTLNAAAMGDLGRALGDNAQSLSGIMQVSGYGGEAPRYVSDTVSLVWGPANMGGGFDLTAGQNGYFGTLVLNVADEQGLLEALTRQGVLSSGEAFMANMVIGSMPQSDDGRRTLNLTVRDNNVALGPLKIGRLPF